MRVKAVGVSSCRGSATGMFVAGCFLLGTMRARRDRPQSGLAARPQGSPAKGSGRNFHLNLKASAGPWPAEDRPQRSEDRTAGLPRGCGRKAALKMYRKFSQALGGAPSVAGDSVAGPVLGSNR